MFESAVAVPLIIAGPEVPAGRVARTNAMLVDLHPTILELAGATPSSEDASLPGRSLLSSARGSGTDRVAFSEYHAVFSRRGMFMLRAGRFKYVRHVDGPPELFDLDEDPDELCDLALDGNHEDIRHACEKELSHIVDAEAVDARARADQRRRLDAGGGLDHVRDGGPKIIYTPPPPEFQHPTCRKHAPPA
jgi:choline-sulfatase